MEDKINELASRFQSLITEFQNTKCESRCATCFFNKAILTISDECGEDEDWTICEVLINKPA